MNETVKKERERERERERTREKDYNRMKGVVNKESE